MRCAPVRLEEMERGVRQHVLVAAEEMVVEALVHQLPRTGHLGVPVVQTLAVGGKIVGRGDDQDRVRHREEGIVSMFADRRRDQHQRHRLRELDLGEQHAAETITDEHDRDAVAADASCVGHVPAVADAASAGAGQGLPAVADAASVGAADASCVGHVPVVPDAASVDAADASGVGHVPAVADAASVGAGQGMPDEIDARLHIPREV